MQPHLSPLPFLADVVEMFEDGGRGDGLAAFDPVLCRTFAQGLSDLASAYGALLSLCVTHGLVEGSFVEAEPARRTAAERALLAARAVAEADGPVVPFPAGRRADVFQGGPAA